MPTIICDARRFAFIHIPKTAGTTISRQLKSALPHDPAFAEGWTAHPELGNFYNDHRTLRQISLTAPDTLEKIRDFDAVAVCREPLSRFQSALGQYLRNTSGEALADLSPADLAALVDDVLAKLRTDDLGSLPMTFFRRQADYIFHDGEQLVDHLFDYRDLGALSAHLDAELGVSLETGRTFRSADNHAWKRRNKRPIVRMVKPLAKRVLPDPMIARFRSLSIARLKTEADQRLNRVLDTAHRRSFLIDYYGEDFEICKRLEPTRVS
jgi:hypothetical protein